MSESLRISRDMIEGRPSAWEVGFGHLCGRPGVRLLEIGSFEGQGACWLLEHILTHPTARLTCVDPFTADAAWLATIGLDAGHDYEAVFDANVRAIDAGDRVVKVRATAREALGHLPLGAFDGVYVDGSHRAVDTLTDLVLSWDLLKLGGRLVLDDYKLEEGEIPPGVGRPRDAADAFLRIFGRELTVVHRGYLLVVERHAPVTLATVSRQRVRE